MNLYYGVSGERRKALVNAISEILGEDAVYLGAPSFAYDIDGYSISRDGTVSCPDGASREDVEQLAASLREMGYVPQNEDDLFTFTVELPRDGFSEEAYSNLRKIIASKAPVLRKALETDTLSVEMSKDKLAFPWFTLHGLEGEADAYIQLVTAMYRMAKEQKRVTARARNFTNEKLTMRIFLIRLGFVGETYKAARRILLRNLTGNSSWKYGSPSERAERGAAK